MANQQSVSVVRATPSYLTAADSAGLSVTADLTLEAWIKPSSEILTTGDTRRVIGKGISTGSQQGYGFGYRDISNPTANLYIEISNDGAAPDIRSVDTAIPLDTWTHIAVTFKGGTGAVVFYKNGSQIGTATSSKTAIFDNTAKMVISGNDAAGPGVYFDGKIDEVRIWAETKSGADILANYLRELTGGESNLRAYYKFATGTETTDNSGNGNALTAANGPTYTTDVPFTDTVAGGGLLLMGVGS